MNRNALTSVKVAFEAGFRAALRGASILKCSYKNPLMVTAFERGWQRGTELKRKKG